MKNQISNDQRSLNILTKAIELGFEIDQREIFETILDAASDYLIANSSDVIEEFCEVTHSSRQQNVSWNDEHGFNFECWGEIMQYDKFAKPETKYFHSTYETYPSDSVYQ